MTTAIFLFALVLISIFIAGALADLATTARSIAASLRCQAATTRPASDQHPTQIRAHVAH